jgi:hypothetical protein
MERRHSTHLNPLSVDGDGLIEGESDNRGKHVSLIA